MGRYTARLLVEMPIGVYRFTGCTARLFRRLLNGLSQNVLNGINTPKKQFYADAGSPCSLDSEFRRQPGWIYSRCFATLRPGPSPRRRVHCEPCTSW